MKVGVQFTTHDIEICMSDDEIYKVAKIFNAIESMAGKYGASSIYMKYDERTKTIITQVLRNTPKFDGSCMEEFTIPYDGDVSHWALADALFYDMAKKNLL